MTNDQDGPRTNEQIAAELAAIRKFLADQGKIQTMLPQPPAEALTGADARLISDSIKLLINERVASFLPAEEIDRRINREINDRLNAIGLRTDPEHVEETGEAIRAALKWHRRLDKVIGGMIATALAAIITALLHAAGIILPSSSSTTGGSN